MNDLNFENDSNNYDFVENITPATIAKDHLFCELGYSGVSVGDDEYSVGVLDEFGCAWLNSNDSTNYIASLMADQGHGLKFVCEALGWRFDTWDEYNNISKSILMDSSHALYEEAKLIQDIMVEGVKCRSLSMTS